MSLYQPRFINLDSAESSDSFSEIITNGKKFINHNGVKVEIDGDKIAKIINGKKQLVQDAIEKAMLLKDTKMEEFMEKREIF